LIVLFLVDDRGKNNKSENTMNALSFLRNSTLLSVIPGGGSIGGITILDSELFILRAESTEVNVYNTNNFTLTRNISITGSYSLIAVIASSRYNCLYICDNVLDVVYRYNLSNNNITEWDVGGTCVGLSLTRTDNVLVTLEVTNQIQEYTPEGTLIITISLDSSIEDPWFCVELSSDRYVVSHHQESLHRVCLVDNRRRIIHCYGGASGSGVGQLNGPSHLAVDSHGNVLVADIGNNRVVLLSPSLTHLGYIEIPGYQLGLQLSHPFALYLDELTRRLYIGELTEHDTGRVFVLAV